MGLIGRFDIDLRTVTKPRVFMGLGINLIPQPMGLGIDLIPEPMGLGIDLIPEPMGLGSIP